MKSLKSKFILYLKGISMGAADVVPGVSGGTIAFITGIYQELLDTISSIKPSLFFTLKNEGFLAFWNKINGNFIVPLFLGIATSILVLSKLIAYLLQYHPIPLWAFFFGLILASIFYIGKQITTWNLQAIIGIILGTLFIISISILPPLSPNSSVLFLFFSGFLAATAMILPGISGSFILLILGSYSLIINALNKLTELDESALIILVPVILGVIMGLVSTANVLSFLLKKYYNTILSILTGFLLGSLYKVWPWKATTTVFNKENFQEVNLWEFTNHKFGSLTAYNSTIEKDVILLPLKEKNILPSMYSHINIQTDNQFFAAIIFGFVGFLLLFFIEYIAKDKKNV